MVQLLVGVDGLQALCLRSMLAAGDFACFVRLTPQIRQQRHRDKAAQNRQAADIVFVTMAIGELESHRASSPLSLLFYFPHQSAILLYGSEILRFPYLRPAVRHGTLDSLLFGVRQ